ncbi:RadC family protein [[Ruminococcus] torques]|uniref:RadC family protein n=1 Tax=[Ruminococcus] torques TaxID=33039 RepID=UPI001F9E2764|nr:DNA repair protein RadC [[Ruminococcus] torques]MBS5397679.1 DNA repair protein RadC [Lachnospiraceae bacterium]MDM8235721.1 DNA repair protein RadC [[Ruminococcus] torques]HJC79864.1 DNA repair protein RadC [Candidatus Mediterraneibacter excrementipullorum]
MGKNNTIKDMHQEDRPYEKCERFGAENLTDAELLAVLLRTGTQGENSLQLAHRLIRSERSGRGILNIHRWTFEQLMRIKGIGRVKAVQILCLSELAKRMARSSATEGLDFSNPQTVARYYMEDMRHKEKEVTKLLLLNTKAKLIGECVISVGTVDAALVSPRELFIEALKRNASAIILLHNHPSGDPSPSREDVRITRRIYEAGALLGISLLDHIIIGDNCFISLKEQGLFQ